MSGRPEKKRAFPARRFAMAEAACPACGTILVQDSPRCPSCRFTGADTMTLFPNQPPPLDDILDAAGVWDDAALREIRNARKKLRRNLPQLDWRVCSVTLNPADDLNAFGFWLFNASPLLPGETEEARAWTVLLVINSADGRVTAVPGYAAEPWLTDEEWRDALRAMFRPWQKGRPAAAVTTFFTTAAKAYDRALVRVLRSNAGKELP
jgi:hypothetical protein